MDHYPGVIPSSADDTTNEKHFRVSGKVRSRYVGLTVFPSGNHGTASHLAATVGLQPPTELDEPRQLAGSGDVADIPEHLIQCHRRESCVS